MDRVYLDTNIIIPLVVDNPSLEERRGIVIPSLDALSEINVELCVSGWTLTEMMKVMINGYSVPPKKAAVIHNSITETSSVGGYEIKLIPPSLKSTFSITDLFRDVREIMAVYSPGWGDAIHCVTMRQNDLDKILSMDAKRDFKIIPGLEVLHPETLKIG